MMDSILRFYEKAVELVSIGVPVSVIRKSGAFEELIRIKYNIPNDDFSAFEDLNGRLEKILEEIEAEYRK